MRIRDERPKQPVQLKEDECELLKKITAKRTEKYNIVLRAKIILMADEGVKFQVIAKKLEIRKDSVTDWTVRWHNTSDKPVQERLMDFITSMIRWLNPSSGLSKEKHWLLSFLGYLGREVLVY